MFRCVGCRRRFNERSGTPFNDLSVPTDIVCLVVLWRLRYPLRLRHLIARAAFFGRNVFYLMEQACHRDALLHHSPD